MYHDRVANARAPLEREARAAFDLALTLFRQS